MGQTPDDSQLKLSNWQGGILEDVSSSTIDQESIAVTEDKLLNSTNRIVFDADTVPLSDHFLVKFGMQLRDRKIYVGDVITTEDEDLITPYHKPCYTGKDFGRYVTNYAGRLAYYNREAQRGGCWDETIHAAQPKVLIRQIGKIPVCSLDKQGFYCLNTLFMVVPKKDTLLSAHFLLGILNSQLMGNYWTNTFYDMRTTFPKIKGSYLEQLPLPQLDLKNGIDRKRHDTIAVVVDQLLKGYAELAQLKLSSSRERAQAKLQHLDRRLDELVFDLYGLSKEDRKFVKKN